MIKKWYAVRHDSAPDQLDNGSTRKREALQIARAVCKKYPDEGVYILPIDPADNELVGEVITIRESERYMS